MNLGDLLKNFIILILFGFATFAAYTWVNKNNSSADLTARYQTEDQPDAIVDEDDNIYLDDCQRHLDPIVIELCIESKTNSY